MKRDKPTPVVLTGYISRDSMYVVEAAVSDELDDILVDDPSDLNDYYKHPYRVTVTIEEL